jgi:hypothetical protein
MPQYTAGQRIRGSEINALPQLYFVAADLVKNNSNTFSDATGLAFAAEANGRYLVECFLAYQSDATRDIKFQWTSPAGTTGWWAADGINAGDAGGAVGQVNRQTLAAVGGIHGFNGENGAGINVNAKPVAMFLIGGTAGTVQLQWAQLTAGAFNSTLLAGSCIRVSKMA